jgi:hypothetical protein
MQTVEEVDGSAGMVRNDLNSLSHFEGVPSPDSDITVLLVDPRQVRARGAGDLAKPGYRGGVAAEALASCIDDRPARSRSTDDGCEYGQRAVGKSGPGRNIWP